MKEIHVGQRRGAKHWIIRVDDEDYEWLSLLPWTAHYTKTHVYATVAANHSLKYLYMHRLVLNAPACLQVDHKDNCGLNNQKDNLRFCTNAQNNQNKSKILGRSRFKGVYWHKIAQKWQAHIVANGRHVYLGLHDTEEGAAQAYNEAATRLHGAFARVNTFSGWS